MTGTQTFVIWLAIILAPWVSMLAMMLLSLFRKHD